MLEKSSHIECAESEVQTYETAVSFAYDHVRESHPGRHCELTFPLGIVETEMFGFFKKRREERVLQQATKEKFRKITEDLQSGRGNLLEAALGLHHAEKTQESAARLIFTIGKSDVYILNADAELRGNFAMVTDAEGNDFIVAFSSQERAEAAAKSQTEFQPMKVSWLELVFGLNVPLGVVLNVDDDAFRWAANADQIENLREAWAECVGIREGGIYTVASGQSYQAAKLLKVDERGVHIRLYANAWEQRPAKVVPTELSLSSPEGEEGKRAIGHMPLTRQAFLLMGPFFVTEEPVTEEELDGYRMWEGAKGGYFGN